MEIYQNNDIVIGGSTQSASASLSCDISAQGVFPICKDGYSNATVQYSLDGTQDGFIANFSNDVLQLSTYLGGTGIDVINDFALGGFELPDGEHPYVENLYIAGSGTSSDHLPFYGNPVNWGNYDYLRALGLAPYNNITSPFCAIYIPDYEKAVVDFLQSIEQPAQVAFVVNNATTNANAVASWLYYFFFTGTTTGMSFYTIRSDGDHTFDMPDGTSFTVYGIYQNGTLYPSNGGVPLSSPGVNNNDAFMNRHSLLPMPMIGIGEKKTNLGNNIILFPNPSDNEVRFINISYQTTIEVYNQNGQLVEKRTNTSNGNISLQIADWPKGLYIVRIGGEKDNPTTLKLIKQ